MMDKAGKASEFEPSACGSHSGMVAGAQNRHTLVLFTATFPYGRGEQFLETELPYLVEAFERVVIVPGRAPGPPRPVPPRSLVDLGLAVRSAPLSGASRLGNAKKIGWEILQGHIAWRRPAAAVRRMLGMYAEAARVHDWAASRSAWVWEGGQPLWYTYWLGGATLGGVFVKNALGPVRVVSRAHRMDLYAEEHALPYLPFREAILSGLDALYVVSEHGALYARDRWPGHAEKVYVSRLGVRDPGFVAQPSAAGALRVVSCSFMVPVKRIDLIIEALADLAAREPRLTIEWTHIGAGELCSELEERARERLDPRVCHRFLGELENRQVYEFYQNNPVDVFVNVSASEGVPVSIMEAQSCAIPVVATGVGGTPEIVNDSNGRLLSSNPGVREVSSALREFVAGNVGVADKRKESRRTWQRSSDAAINYPTFVDALTRHVAVPGVRYAEPKGHTCSKW